MSQQLAYVIITPIRCTSRERAAFFTRLLTRTGLELVGARMFAPSAELVKKYSEETISANDPQDRRIQELIFNYIVQNLSPDPKTGRNGRVMVLLFQGEDAVRKTARYRQIQPGAPGVKPFATLTATSSRTKTARSAIFEPAVLAAPTADEAESNAKALGQYSIRRRRTREYDSASSAVGGGQDRRVRK